MTAVESISYGGTDGTGQPRGGPAAAVFPVEDASQVGEVRRAAATLAGAVGLSEAEGGTLAVIVTEMATNLAKHARRGRILLLALGEAPRAGVEALSLDEGPGIANMARAMGDGFSTAGSAGQGLGAMRRMAHDFDIYSRPGDGGGGGTAIVARVWSAAALAGGERVTAASAASAAGNGRLADGAVCVPVAGEVVCGDAWAVVRRPDRTLVALVDGLGHGADAAVAASEAVRVVRAHPDASPADLLHAAHGALRSTRGAAVAIAAVYPQRGTLTFAGVGNISAAIYTGAGATRSLASHNGTVGHAMRTVREFAHQWTPDSGLVMHTDGLHTRWRLDAYPGLPAQHPSLLAGVLFRDASRGRDDATALALRGNGGAR